MSLPNSISLLLFAVSLPAQQAVEVVPVLSRSVERTVRLPGELLPYESVDLHARVTGFVERVLVDRGSVVRKGQLLVMLAAPELEAQRAEAEAKAEAIAAQRAEAEAKLVAAQSTYERLKTASATPGAVAGIEVIQAEKAVEAARALVRATEASEKAARSSTEALKRLESYLLVTAPFDGVITERNVHPGALAGPGSGAGSTPLLRLEQNTRLRLVVAVPEAEVAGIVKGARVPFSLPAYPGETFAGVVARVARSLDPKTRTMAVELDVQNAGVRLAPGMYPEVQWPVRKARASLLVPPSSIVTTTERSFVIRVQGGRAEYVDVSRGAPAGDLVEVYGALRGGDRIVRQASDEIREGTALKTRLAGKQAL